MVFKDDRDIGWKFEISKSGDVEGLNDGAIETFRDDHLLSLAKESAQNSLDAWQDKSRPVILEFNTFEINSSEFPDIENFKEIIRLEIDYWKKAKKDTSSEEFFKEAKSILESKKIFCLRISDFNTTGLEGSKGGMKNAYSRWWKLVRSQGVTDNDSLAGGSFGLGKFASFACSKLRTVFYSTRDLESIEAHQGVSILASFDNCQGERTRKRGYFCNKTDFSCIDGPLKLDKNFKRDSPGTDLIIFGFSDGEKDLEDTIFSSILRSFLLAIYEGNLVFILNGKRLDRENLKEVIDKYRNEIYLKDLPREIIEYYDLLEGNVDFKEYYFSMFEKDDILLKLGIGLNLHKKIGVFRNNGMKIFDKKGIRGYNDFAGIFLLKGKKVNAYFRNLENPEHNNWRPERLSDSDKRREAKEKINLLFDFMTSSLKNLEEKILPESENIEGIDSLLDEEPEDEGKIKLDGLDFSPLKIQESKTKRKLIKKKIKIRTGDGGGGSKVGKKESSDGDFRGNFTGDEGTSGPGDNRNEKSFIELFPEDIKVFKDKEENYNLLFSLPENSESVRCEIFISGEDFNELAEIENARIIESGSEVEIKSKANNIFLKKIKKNIPLRIIFKLKEDENWPLEVNLYED